MITTGGQLTILLNKLIDDLDGLTVTISQNVNFKAFLCFVVSIYLIVKMSLVQSGRSKRVKVEVLIVGGRAKVDRQSKSGRS